jgi:hypothetical protein
MSSKRTTWVLPALAAGLVSTTLGAALGASQYFALPGAMRIDWTLMLPILVAYAGVTGVLAGLGLGGGMVIAAGGRGRGAAIGRLLGGAVAGAVVGLTLPAVAGIAGFGSVDGPYAGTGNILLSTLVSATAFVGLWAPHLDTQPGRLRPLPRLGLSALSSLIAAATVGTLLWIAHQQLGIVPTFDWMADTAERWGLVPFAAVAGVLVSVAIGLFLGFASWLYLTMAIAFDRR